MKNILILPALLFTLAGCATVQDDPRKREHAQATIPTCKADRECEMKWAAARKWVLTNSSFKMKLMTSDYMETYSPTGGSALIAVRVSKEPVVSGGYRLVVGVWCDNMFGCVPDAWDAAIAFNKEVSATKF